MVAGSDKLTSLFERFSNDPFRRRFRLLGRELAHLQMWGIERVMKDARQLIQSRVAPASPKNDGRQTPWRNHPVFVAQHGTATCCRGCIAKWHQIEAGEELTSEQLDYLLNVVRHWLLQFL